MSLIGRWVHPNGHLIDISNPEGSRALGRWRGEKGGSAGFIGRIDPKGRVIKGVWFDADVSTLEHDSCKITITLDDDKTTFTAVATSKAGSDETWTARREVIPRTGGKLTTFAFKSKDAMERLARRPDTAAIDAARTALLATSIKESEGFHRVDGSLTYIPPLCIADPFDDTAMRRHQQHSRHKGKQVGSGVNIAGRTPFAAKAPSFAWEADPYLDQSTLFKLLRKREREHKATSIPPSLRDRKQFRPTNTTEVTAEVTYPPPVFISTYVDASLAEEVMTKMAHDAVTATKTDLGSSHLKKADTGKLEVVFGKRNMVAGYPHWTIAADKGPEHLPDEFDAARVAARTEALAASKKLAGRPAFAPVGPRILRHAAGATDDAGAAAAAAAAEEAPKRPATGKDAKSDKPPFNPYSHYDPDRYSKHAEYMPVEPPAGPPAPVGKAAAGATGKTEGGDRPSWRSCAAPDHPSRLVTSVALLPKNIAAFNATFSSGGASSGAGAVA